MYLIIVIFNVAFKKYLVSYGYMTMGLEDIIKDTFWTTAKLCPNIALFTFYQAIVIVYIRYVLSNIRPGVRRFLAALPFIFGSIFIPLKILRAEDEFVNNILFAAIA